jgi:hypothetical protein
VSTRSLSIGTSASLIAFAGVFVAGFLAFVPFAEKPAIANVDDVASSTVRCERQAGLQINTGCLSRRGLPWMAGDSIPAAAPLEVAAPDAQLIPEAQQSALLFQDHGERVLPQSAWHQSTGEQPAPAALIEPPSSEAPMESTIIAEPVLDTTPTPSPPVTKRHVSKSAIEVRTGPIAPKVRKVSHRNRQRNPPVAEDLQHHPKLNGKSHEFQLAVILPTAHREPL